MNPLHIHVTLAAFNHMAMNGSRLTVMLFAATLGASPALIGLLAALFGLVGAFVAVPVGAALDVAPVYWAVAACMLGDAWINRDKLRAPKKLPHRNHAGTRRCRGSLGESGARPMLAVN